MVALKNGVIQNKDGHPFDRSTGTWKNQNVAENPSVAKEDASNSNSQDTTTNKNSDTTTENLNSEKAQQTDNQKVQSDTAKEKTPAETPKPTAETPKPTAETPKPHIISYNIDGKYVDMSVDDLAHFKELRRQLASGIPLDDDLITKMKPILAEAHLRDGTKIFNDKTKLSQLDNIMKHYQGKQISSLDEFLKYVLHTIR